MISNADRRKASRTLLDAEKKAKPARQLQATFAALELEDAYAIQSLTAETRIGAGARLRGYKVGLTSRWMQIGAGVSEPTYGHLLEAMFFNDGDRIPTERYIVPRVEAEVAFVMGKALKGPGVTLLDVLDAADYVIPALELVDGRTQYPRGIADNVADNSSAAGVVLGGRAVRPADVDLRWVGALLYRNGVIEETGISAGVMGHPAQSVAWLTNKLGASGAGLEAGHVVLTGSMTRVVPVKRGDTVHADFGPLGGMSVHFG